MREQIAKEVGRSRDYLAAHLSHQAVHGNEGVHLLSREVRADGTPLIGKPSEALVVTVSLPTTGSALQVMDAASRLLALDRPTTYDDLVARLNALHDVDITAKAAPPDDAE